jgi:hypothetical protein
VLKRSRFNCALAILVANACGGTPREATRPEPSRTPTAATPPSTGKLAELETPPRKKLLEIDWNATSVASEAEALALWQRIAPTADDWEAKLEEIPSDSPIAGQLALALLRGGNFTCIKPPPPRDCPMRTPVDIDPPAPAADLDDPCLRRMLALWAIEELDDAQTLAAYDALKAIAAIPPPESQLIAAALDALPESEQDKRLELRAIAMRAGHRELVNGRLSGLDDAHMVEAVKLQIDGALEALTATTHRALFLAAVADERMHPSARTSAITELVAEIDGPLPRDLNATLVKATKSSSCSVAAAASRVLVQRGQRKLAPARPRARTIAPMMRALCVLASYEAMQQADEPSYLLGYIPAKGLEQLTITYDPYGEHDTDGDGDPHTERSLVIVPRNEVVIPQVEDMIKAFARCDGPVCKSDDYEYRFGFKPGAGGLMLARLEIIERPPCPNPG